MKGDSILGGVAVGYDEGEVIAFKLLCSCTNQDIVSRAIVLGVLMIGL